MICLTLSHLSLRSSHGLWTLSCDFAPQLIKHQNGSQLPILTQIYSEGDSLMSMVTPPPSQSVFQPSPVSLQRDNSVTNKTNSDWKNLQTSLTLLRLQVEPLLAVTVLELHCWVFIDPCFLIVSIVITRTILQKYGHFLSVNIFVVYKLCTLPQTSKWSEESLLLNSIRPTSLVTVKAASKFRPFRLLFLSDRTTTSAALEQSTSGWFLFLIVVHPIFIRNI